MTSDLYKQVKQLMKKNQLTFSCSHRVNSKHYLQKKPESFLEQVQLGSFLASKRNPLVLHNEFCFQCGQYLNYRLEGTQLVPSNEKTPCFNENEITVDISVPSGELMLADWHEHASDVLASLQHYRNINAVKERVNTTLDYAQENIGYFYVGNTCPRVFQLNNTLTIGHNSYDEEENEIPLVPGASLRGSIGTDLWWVTLCDRSIYEQLAIKQEGKEKGKRMADEAVNEADVTVSVEPGMYRLTYFVKANDENPRYATFEKIN